MNKRLKFFFIAFLVSFFGVFVLNAFQQNLESAFYAQISQPFQQIYEVKIPEKPQKPNLDYNPPTTSSYSLREQAPSLQAKAAISVLIDSQGGKRVFFKKNSDERLPIASLTKLMTANIVLENYDLSREIKISEEAVAQNGEAGKLTAGKIFSVEYLLYPLLMESSNDAAYALTNDYNEMTEEKFIELMNLKAKKLDLKNTHFFNSSGLELKGADNSINYSTAEDLVEFTTKDLLKKSSIWDILATPKYSFYGPELTNTNELLGKIPNIIGGKTGWEDRAGGCMLLVLKKDNNYIINVILGTVSEEARIEEMEKLIEWLNL